MECHGNCALKYVGGILKLIKLHFRGLKGQFNVKKPILGDTPMTQFNKICQGNYALRYVGGVLVIRKLNFMGLEG